MHELVYQLNSSHSNDMCINDSIQSGNFPLIL